MQYNPYKYNNQNQKNHQKQAVTFVQISAAIHNLKSVIEGFQTLGVSDPTPNGLALFFRIHLIPPKINV